MKRLVRLSAVPGIHQAERKPGRSLPANALVPRKAGPNAVALVKVVVKTPKKAAIASRVVEK